MAEQRVPANGGEIVVSATQVFPEKKLSIASPGAMVSIIVPCCGMIEYTKLCVPSLLRYTRLPFEMIFLDIGSRHGTADYLPASKAASTLPQDSILTAADL